MRHVRREFAAVLLCRFALGDVKSQQHRAHRCRAGEDTAHVKLPDAAAALGAGFAVPLRHRVCNGKADIVAAVKREKILTDAALVRVKKPARGGVNAQHTFFFVEQDETLSHAAGDLRKLHPLLLQLAHLLVDLPVLMVDAPEQRGKLLVGVVFQRVLQIQLVERAHDAARKPPCQHRRQNERHDDHDQDGLHHANEQHARRCAADGNTQHAAVREPARAVHRLLQDRGGIARAFALAARKSLAHFFAVGVVFKTLRVGHGVVEHRAVGRDPCQAVALGGDA